ncbi:MAG: aminomethyl-transferring glycine dehydrogenase subunit GcvPA [Hahellaceae bacterium]|nr:aminomethyl-transferring glycine dehydrogenase subunit GcvPA [Hahellaceae bacterium]MCP5210573.1 aminomethyl-transferring glycine dehydrogenase subunit GcvPA [Hahellaceae bacterium]
MPFIPHTEADVARMLETIGAASIDDLFDEIPAHLRCKELTNVETGKSEMEMLRLMSERAEQDAGAMCFIGAGAYEHHVPSAVWDVATRGEFMTAYTPYQAEASQGTLQLIYEFQSMMTALTGLDVSNASLYDGASGLAEAILMAIRANRKSKSNRVLALGTVSPLYRKACKAIVGNQDIELVEVDVNDATLTTDLSALDPYQGEDYAALVISQPGFMGTLEDVNALTDWAHAQGMLVIAVVNPTSLAILEAPGLWGARGADIAVGDGQPLGIPLSSGGPYYGFICCKKALVRQMPGRIIGRTVDLEGKPGYTLTLQAREQHIRRAKATSNICTNQGLAVTASTIYMSLLGPQGLANVAEACAANARALQQQLAALDGVKLVGCGDIFHEFVIETRPSAALVLEHMEKQGILGGWLLEKDYPTLKNTILVCVTETKMAQDLSLYVQALKTSIAEVEG